LKEISNNVGDPSVILTLLGEIISFRKGLQLHFRGLLLPVVDL
jgi:hypothetical protein